MFMLCYNCIFFVNKYVCEIATKYDKYFNIFKTIALVFCLYKPIYIISGATI